MPLQCMNYRELLLGCGHKRDKRIFPIVTESSGLSHVFHQWQNLITLDVNSDCQPDIVADLQFDSAWDRFPRNYFHEIHAYEVLEHLGKQGDFQGFFKMFSDIWNLLVSDGFLCATVPSRFSPWLWGDPGHRRAILPDSLIFLDQTEYKNQCGRTSMSDYRFCYQADFRVIDSQDDRITHSFILQAVKPSRIEERKT